LHFNRTFLSSYGQSIALLASEGGGGGAAVAAQAPNWRVELAEEVCACFGEQVHLLIDTGKQMDSALQRRSKIRNAATSANSANVGAGLSDYEKIALQIKLDVDAFGEELLRFLKAGAGADAAAAVQLFDFSSYVEMQREISESIAAASAAK
jgi:hypothetical protein